MYSALSGGRQFPTAVTCSLLTPADPLPGLVAFLTPLKVLPVQVAYTQILFYGLLLGEANLRQVLKLTLVVALVPTWLLFNGVTVAKCPQWFQDPVSAHHMPKLQRVWESDNCVMYPSLMGASYGANNTDIFNGSN